MRELFDRLLSAARSRAASLLLGLVGAPLAFCVRRVAMLSPGGGVALVYHRVGDPAGDPRGELVPALASSLFAVQVRHLAAHYRLTTASELRSAARQRRRGARFPVAITFDDDLSSHVEMTAPILTSAGATATFFISGASLDRPYRFWWERLQAAVDNGMDLTALGLGAWSRRTDIHELGRQIQALSPRERDDAENRLEAMVGPDPAASGLRAEAVRRLASSGLEIGFHTKRHYYLPALDDEQLFQAMRSGRSELEQLLGRQLRTISYPHGGGDARVADAARQAGFEAGFTGVPAAVAAESDPLLLGRVWPSHRSVGELAFRVAWALLRATLSDKARAMRAHQDRPAAGPRGRG